ncbi:MAG: hypothetical protein U0V87_14730 [Acidobacteriota bacterium]
MTGATQIKRGTADQSQVLVCTLLLLMSTFSWSATTQTIKREGIALRAGSLAGMAISPAGSLVPRVAASVLDRPSVPVLWDMVAIGNDLYAGGGEGTGVWRIGSTGPAEPIPLPKQEADVFALLAGKNGDLYVASGPDGAVYRLDTKSRRYEEMFRPKSSYIWDLAWAPDGALLVATGMPARVYKLTPKAGASAQTIYESRESHIKSLCVTRSGRIIAGTASSGWVLELDGKSKGFVLADGDRSEVTSIVEDPRGALWAAFSGPVSVAAASVAKPRAESNAASEVITVTAEASSEGKDEKSEKPAASSRPVELPGGGGVVLRLRPGAEPEVAWSDEKETPLDLEPLEAGGLLIAVANPARVWWLDDQLRRGWWELREESRATTAIAKRGDGLAIAYGNPAALVSYGPGLSQPSRWTSEVLDAKTRATIGRLRAQVDAANAAHVTLLVRCGNTLEPGDGWTDWIVATGAAGPSGSDGGAAVGLPKSRYFQLRVEADAAASRTLSIDLVSASYRGSNRTPVVDAVDVQPAGVAYRAMPPSAVSSGDMPVVPVPRGIDAERALGDSASAWRSKRVYEADAVTVTWQGSDPDGDAVRYRVEYCRSSASGCAPWVVLARDLETQFYSFDGRWLQDGVYRFRVTASDGIGNPAAEALSADAISEEALIDHSAPAIDPLQAVRRKDGSVEVSFTASDPGGRIVRGEVSAAPGAWNMLVATDGVDDGAQERYLGVIEVPDSEFQIEVRAVDAAGNVTTRVTPVR